MIRHLPELLSERAVPTPLSKHSHAAPLAPSSGALPCVGTKRVPPPCRGDVRCGQGALSSLPCVPLPPDHVLQTPTSLCLTAGTGIQRDLSRFLPV